MSKKFLENIKDKADGTKKDINLDDNSKEEAKEILRKRDALDSLIVAPINKLFKHKADVDKYETILQKHKLLTNIKRDLLHSNVDDLFTKSLLKQNLKNLVNLTRFDNDNEREANERYYPEKIKDIFKYIYGEKSVKHIHDYFFGNDRDKYKSDFYLDHVEDLYQKMLKDNIRIRKNMPIFIPTLLNQFLPDILNEVGVKPENYHYEYEDGYESFYYTAYTDSIESKEENYNRKLDELYQERDKIEYDLKNAKKVYDMIHTEISPVHPYAESEKTYLKNQLSNVVEMYDKREKYSNKINILNQKYRGLRKQRNPYKYSSRKFEEFEEERIEKLQEIERQIDTLQGRISDTDWIYDPEREENLGLYERPIIERDSWNKGIWNGTGVGDRIRKMQNELQNINFEINNIENALDRIYEPKQRKGYEKVTKRIKVDEPYVFPDIKVEPSKELKELRRNVAGMFNPFLSILDTGDYSMINPDNYILLMTHPDKLQNIHQIENLLYEDGNKDKIYKKLDIGLNDEEQLMLNTITNDEDYEIIPLYLYPKIFKTYSGNSNPFALRKHQQGILKMLEKDIHTNIRNLGKYADDKRQFADLIKELNTTIINTPNKYNIEVIKHALENMPNQEDLEKYIAENQNKSNLSNDQKIKLLETAAKLKEIRNKRLLFKEILDQQKMGKGLKEELMKTNVSTINNYLHTLDAIKEIINNDDVDLLNSDGFKEYIINEGNANPELFPKLQKYINRILDIYEKADMNVSKLRDFVNNYKPTILEINTKEPEKKTTQKEPELPIETINTMTENNLPNGTNEEIALRINELPPEKRDATINTISFIEQNDRISRINQMDNVIQEGLRQNREMQTLNSQLVQQENELNRLKGLDEINEKLEIRNALDEKHREYLETISRHNAELNRRYKDLSDRLNTNFSTINEIRDDMKRQNSDFREHLLKQQNLMTEISDTKRLTEESAADMEARLADLNIELERNKQEMKDALHNQWSNAIYYFKDPDNYEKIADNISQKIKINNTGLQADILRIQTDTDARFEEIEKSIQQKVENNRELYHELNSNLQRMFNELNLEPQKQLLSKEYRYKVRFDNAFANEDKVRAALMEQKIKLTDEDQIKQEYFKTHISQSKLKEALGFLPNDPDLTLSQVEKYLPGDFFHDVISQKLNKEITPIKIKTTNYEAVKDIQPLDTGTKNKLLKLYFYYKDPRMRTAKKNEYPREFLHDITMLNLKGKPAEVLKIYQHYLRTGRV